jgi:mannose-6-phosphate isomerase
VNTHLTAQHTVQPHYVRRDKPWGWETLWAETEFYVGKILHINAGKRISLQYHDEKIESQCLLAGRAWLLIEDRTGALKQVEMEKGKGYTIRPFQRHRITAVEETQVLEVSTPESGTTFRVEDDYSRPHEIR